MLLHNFRIFPDYIKVKLNIFYVQFNLLIICSVVERSFLYVPRLIPVYHTHYLKDDIVRYLGVENLSTILISSYFLPSIDIFSIIECPNMHKFRKLEWVVYDSRN